LSDEIITQMVFNSQNKWENGHARFISKDGETDPYDPTMLSVHGGSGGRQFYINGKGAGFLSGDQARLRVKASAYSSQIELTVLWNSTLSSMSLRFRERHNYPAPDANKFGGYAIVLEPTQLKFYRETVHETYADLSPATASLPFTFTSGNAYHIKARCYDNAAHTAVNLKCDIDSGSGYVQRGAATDASPTAAMLNSALYHTESNVWIRVNGASVKDVQMRDLRVFDLRDGYTET
jgi:hypothetical protein